MAITVTATQGGGTSAGMLLRVKVLTSAAATQTGATVSSALALNGTITTTVTGSIVYGALSGDAAAGAFSAEPLCTLIDNFHDTSNGEYYGSFRTTSATGTPGATLVGSTTANANRDLAAVEILPNGILTEDGSAPVVATTMTATAVTSASFTPPAGALLVAIVGSDGAASGTLTTMTVSGGGLTWTEAVHAASGATCYAGVWVAQVPGGSPATASGAVTLAGTAGAAAPAAATGSVAVTGTAAGQAPAAASGALAVSGSAAAAAPVTAAGSATFAGTASATAPGTATAAGALAVTGTAAGTAPAGAAGIVTVAGSAAASAPAGASGSLALGGTAAARAAAAAAATLVVSGTAAATAPGAAAGSAVFNGTAAASGPSVTASGLLVLAGTATARAPAAAAGAVTLAGAAAPRAAGAAAGAITITGAAQFVPPFTVGTLTAADAPLAVLGSAAATAGQATLTASDTRTGGPL